MVFYNKFVVYFLNPSLKIPCSIHDLNELEVISETLMKTYYKRTKNYKEDSQHLYGIQLKKRLNS